MANDTPNPSKIPKYYDSNIRKWCFPNEAFFNFFGGYDSIQAEDVYHIIKFFDRGLNAYRYELFLSLDLKPPYKLTIPMDYWLLAFVKELRLLSLLKESPYCVWVYSYAHKLAVRMSISYLVIMAQERFEPEEIGLRELQKLALDFKDLPGTAMQMLMGIERRPFLLREITNLHFSINLTISPQRMLKIFDYIKLHGHDDAPNYIHDIIEVIPPEKSTIIEMFREVRLRPIHLSPSYQRQWDQFKEFFDTDAEGYRYSQNPEDFYRWHRVTPKNQPRRSLSEALRIYIPEIYNQAPHINEDLIYPFNELPVQPYEPPFGSTVIDMLVATYEPFTPITSADQLCHLILSAYEITETFNPCHDQYTNHNYMHIIQILTFFYEVYAQKYREPLVLVHADSPELLIFRHQNVPVGSPPIYVILSYRNSGYLRSSILCASTLYALLLVFGTAQTVRIFQEGRNVQTYSSPVEFFGELNFREFRRFFIKEVFYGDYYSKIPRGNATPEDQFRRDLLQILTLKNRGLRVEFSTDVVPAKYRLLHPIFFLQIWDYRELPPKPLLTEDDLYLFYNLPFEMEDSYQFEQNSPLLHPLDEFALEQAIQEWPLQQKMFEFGFIDDPEDEPEEDDIDPEIDHEPEKPDEMDEMLGMPFYDPSDFADDDEEDGNEDEENDE
jgi:hypothetical protein